MTRHRILLVTNHKHVTGITYYRQLVPHYHLKNKYPKFECSQYTTIDQLTDKHLEKFDMIQFSRFPSQAGQSLRMVERCKKKGLKVVLDIDDWWKLDSFHFSAPVYKERYITQQVEEFIGEVDYVTCTTEILADKIRPLNPNVTVLPNAIDPEQKQYQIRDIASPRIRFGWIGGVFHQQDLYLLYESLKRLWSDWKLRGKWQLVLAGFNIDMTKMENLQGAAFLKRVVHEPYVQYEALMTNRLHQKSWGDMPEYYADYLKTFSPLMEHIGYDQPYRRVWSRNSLNYVQGYNEMDVCLVPLKDTEFNGCKSELKIIEAGFMNKIAIVSNVNPYKNDCIHNDNCLVVNPGRDHIDWYVAIRRLILDKELREELRQNLQNDMLERYHIDVIGKKRYKFYKTILQCKPEVISA